ncbi:MAG: DUF4440 domain-containing protein [Planctomycetes bacterium]|nr:DUF4440 domain-containing protein [Planctomycetota bacterium]
MADDSRIVNELLALTQRLLNAIVTGDWPTYAAFCDPSLTCFEPEARGQLVEGMSFHQFYFDLASPGRRQITVTQPHVRLLGPDAAVVSYVRLTQSVDAQGTPHTSRYEESRVWHRRNGEWKHVHFHRSANE